MLQTLLAFRSGYSFARKGWLDLRFSNMCRLTLAVLAAMVEMASCILNSNLVFHIKTNTATILSRIGNTKNKKSKNIFRPSIHRFEFFMSGFYLETSNLSCAFMDTTVEIG